MFPSIQVQHTDHPTNLLDQTYKEVRKVHLVQKNINPDINLDFEENLPFQECIISEAFQRFDKSVLQEPKELNDLVNTGSLIPKVFTKASRYRQDT